MAGGEWFQGYSVIFKEKALRNASGTDMVTVSIWITMNKAMVSNDSLQTMLCFFCVCVQSAGDLSDCGLCLVHLNLCVHIN